MNGVTSSLRWKRLPWHAWWSLAKLRPCSSWAPTTKAELLWRLRSSGATRLLAVHVLLRGGLLHELLLMVMLVLRVLLLLKLLLLRLLLLKVLLLKVLLLALREVGRGVRVLPVRNLGGHVLCDSRHGGDVLVDGSDRVVVAFAFVE